MSLHTRGPKNAIWAALQETMSERHKNSSHSGVLENKAKNHDAIISVTSLSQKWQGELGSGEGEAAKRAQTNQEGMLIMMM